MEALNLHYVNSIDYMQMATKAIKRCDLLTQVLTVAFAEGSEASKKSCLQSAGAGESDRLVGCLGRASG